VKLAKAHIKLQQVESIVYKDHDAMMKDKGQKEEDFRTAQENLAHLVNELSGKQLLNHLRILEVMVQMEVITAAIKLNNIRRVFRF